MHRQLPTCICSCIHCMTSTCMYTCTQIKAKQGKWRHSRQTEKKSRVGLEPAISGYHDQCSKPTKPPRRLSRPGTNPGISTLSRWTSTCTHDMCTCTSSPVMYMYIHAHHTCTSWHSHHIHYEQSHVRLRGALLVSTHRFVMCSLHSGHFAALLLAIAVQIHSLDKTQFHTHANTGTCAYTLFAHENTCTSHKRRKPRLLHTIHVQ